MTNKMATFHLAPFRALLARKLFVFPLCFYISLHAFAAHAMAAKKTCEQIFKAQKSAALSLPIKKTVSPVLLRDPQFSDRFTHVSTAERNIVVRQSWKELEITINGGRSLSIGKDDREIHAFKISADGNSLAVGYSKDNVVEIYSIANPQDVRLTDSFQWDQQLSPMDIKEKITPQKLKQKWAKEEIRDLQFSEDGGILVAISYVGEGAIFNRSTQTVVPLDIKTWSNGVAFSKDKSEIYIGTRVEQLLVVSTATGELVRTIKNLSGLCQSCGGHIQILEQGFILVQTPSHQYLISPRGAVETLYNSGSGKTFTFDPASQLFFSLAFPANHLSRAPQITKIGPSGEMQLVKKLNFNTAYTNAIRATALSGRLGLAAAGIANNAAVPGDYMYDQLPDIHRLPSNERGRVFVWDIKTGKIVARLISVKRSQEDHTSILSMSFDEPRNQLLVSHASGNTYRFDLKEAHVKPALLTKED